MDPKLMRKLLGLPDSASDAEVQKKLEGHFAAAAKAQAENTSLAQARDKATTEREALVKSLEAAGFKMEGGKPVKLAQAAPIAGKDTDDDEKKELRKLLADTQLSTGRAKVTAAEELAQKYVTGSGAKLPPAVKDELKKLFSLASGAETLALSQDGAAVVQTAFDAVASLRKVLDAIPGSMTKEELSRLGSTTPEEKKEGDALREKGRKMAQSIRPKGRKEAAGTTK